METESVLEQEIAELSRAIESKRSALAAERGGVSEREIVREAVGQLTSPTSSPSQSNSQPKSIFDSTVAAPTNDYLDALDEDSTLRVNNLVASIGEQGFKKAIARAKEEIPYVLDAFHDALVTRLYEELKTRGVVR